MPDETAVAVEQQAESTAQAVETEQAAASAATETSETQTDQAAEEGKKPSEKGGVQRRIDELTKGRRLAEAEAEFWRQKALGTEKPAAAVVEKPKAEPDPADFETTEAYLKATREYDREQLRREMKAELDQREQAAQAREEQELVKAEWVERQEPVLAEHPDYWKVTGVVMNAEHTGVLELSKGPGRFAVAGLLQNVESGPQLLYHFGQNPEELEKICDLEPRQAALAVLRIEARLASDASGGEEKPLPQTKAPKPPTPVKKTSGGMALDPNNPADAEKMSAEDWRKAREAKLKGR